MAKRLTPQQAIIKHCRECMGGVWWEDGREISLPRKKEVTACEAYDCPTFDLRMGSVKGISALKCIRRFCRTCVDNDREIRDCTCGEPNPETGLAVCTFYPHRFGKNPQRKGKGGEGRRFISKIRAHDPPKGQNQGAEVPYGAIGRGAECQQ